MARDNKSCITAKIRKFDNGCAGLGRRDMIRECLLVGANAVELRAVHENERELTVDRRAGDRRGLPEIRVKWRVAES